MATKAEGVYYWDQNGSKIIDGSSGLFCCPAGHGRREIADAVRIQMMQNDYVAPFQLGQIKSFALAQKVTNLLPDPIDHVFFMNSGSEATDTALKIAMACHRVRGDGQRIRFVSRERAYHSVDIGGVSLSGMVRNREAFPATIQHVVLRRHTWRTADCFTYPVAGTTGTLVPPKGYLRHLREIFGRHGILLVFDEVITGFGRLGAPFASHKYEVVPDNVTKAKALTNGAIPMGGVAVS